MLFAAIRLNVTTDGGAFPHLDVATPVALLLIYSHMPWRKGNRLRLVTEEQAEGEARRIYGEIRENLGLPELRLFYPALGVYPTFLKLHWEAVKRLTQSEELFTAAERLRADAYTRAFNYFQIPDLTHSGQLLDKERHELNNIADYYLYKEPLILLLFCLQMQAMEGPAGLGAESSTPHRSAQVAFQAPTHIDEQELSPSLKKRFEEIKRTLNTPYVNPEFCDFGLRPEFLDQYWETLKQMIASPLYDECRYGVRCSAWNFASQLPGRIELVPEQLSEAGMTTEEVASVARILELFVGNISGQLLNVAAAKIALEGGNGVRSERRPANDSSEDQPAA